MRVFLTGATGAIGRFVVPRLVADHDVSALARSKEKAEALTRAGAIAVQVSMFDTEGLVEAFAGHDVVVNLATAIPPMRRAMRGSAWAENNRIRTEGSRAVVDAALAAGVSVLVQESITLTYPDHGDQWIDEDLPIEPAAGVVSIREVEANAARFTDAGRTGVVLRFGAFYGPGSSQSAQILASGRRHIGLVMGRPEGFLSSIYLSDAAAAVTAALGAPPGVYNVVDDEPLTKRNYAAAVGAAVGKRPWLMMPGRAALIGGERTATLTRSQRVANLRFRTATDWAPHYPNARDGWKATVATVATVADTTIEVSHV